MRLLSNLSEIIINRKLLKIRIQNAKFKPSEVNNLLDKMQNKFKITKKYFSDWNFNCRTATLWERSNYCGRSPGLARR